MRMEVGPKAQYLAIKTFFLIASLVSFIMFSGVSQAYELGTQQEEPNNLNSVFNPKVPSKLWSFIENLVSKISQVGKSVNLSNNTTTQNTQTHVATTNNCKEDIFKSKFIDIDNSQYKDYINTLYYKWIIIGSNNKFMPEDNLRFYCMIKILVDSYRSKIGYDLDTQLWLSQKNVLSYYIFPWIDKESLKYLNTAYELWFLDRIDLYSLINTSDYLNHNVDFRTVKTVFENIKNQFPFLINSSSVDQVPDSQSFVKRWEYTKYIVDLFDFPVQSWINICYPTLNFSFEDIYKSPYQNDIQKLADLWIINKNSDKFYPDNYLRKYEFIIMLVNTILEKENQELNIYLLDHISNISDIDINSSYSKHFEYAYHNGFLDYELNPENWKFIAQPNKILKTNEIQKIISKLLWENINLNKNNLNWTITRGEFANILVNQFWLWDKQSPWEENQTTTLSESSSIIDQILSWIKTYKTLSKV